jgi:hypothetical protein
MLWHLLSVRPVVALLVGRIMLLAVEWCVKLRALASQWGVPGLAFVVVQFSGLEECGILTSLLCLCSSVSAPPKLISAR